MNKIYEVLKYILFAELLILGGSIYYISNSVHEHNQELDGFVDRSEFYSPLKWSIIQESYILESKYSYGIGDNIGAVMFVDSRYEDYYRDINVESMNLQRAIDMLNNKNINFFSDPIVTSANVVLSKPLIDYLSNDEIKVRLVFTLQPVLDSSRPRKFLLSCIDLKHNTKFLEELPGNIPYNQRLTYTELERLWDVEKLEKSIGKLGH